MSEGCTVSARFYPPPPDLRAYFTTFYTVSLDVSDGDRATDWLHPEWAGLRFITGEVPDAEIAGSPPLPSTAFIAHGPTSTTVRFSAGTIRMWGVGLLPLGWATFVDSPAHELADTIVDGREHPAFAGFRTLADALIGHPPDPPSELAVIAEFFRARARKVSDEAKILACHVALLDPDVGTVAELAERAGIPAYTLERLCRRHFGFAPQLLLRRQRFMRSLAQFMLDPSLKWIGAMDGHYHDQAQFVRDFHRFMGMGPRDYSSRPHPILAEIMRARFEEAGAAVQALHPPLPEGRTPTSA